MGSQDMRLVEGREWLSRPGEHYIAHEGPGFEDWAQVMIEDLYDVGAVSVMVLNPEDGFSSEIWVSYEFPDGTDVLVNLFRYGPDEVHRIENKTPDYHTVRAWWD